MSDSNNLSFYGGPIIIGGLSTTACDFSFYGGPFIIFEGSDSDTFRDGVSSGGLTYGSEDESESYVGWVKDYTVPVSWDSNSSGHHQFRHVITFANDGTKVAVKLGTYGSNSWVVDGCSIGERSGSTEDFASPPTRITFDDGNNGCTVDPTKWSDGVDFVVDKTKQYLIHLDIASGNHPNKITGSNVCYYNSASGETMVEDVTMTFQSYYRCIEEVIVYLGAETSDYTESASTGGIVYGGEVVEIVNPNYTESASIGGIVLGGPTTSEYEPASVHQVDGTASGGITYGGDSNDIWQTIPNNGVAVKGGTYRIDGDIYTLDETISYPGLGTIAALVDCGEAPASAGIFRYDLISIGTAGIVTATNGTEAATPVMPTLPSGHIKLDHVLRYNGQDTIIQADIGKNWTAPSLTTITITVADDELAWAESSTGITVKCYDQYGSLYSGGAVVNATITSGNGTISPASRSGSYHTFSFTYTRGGTSGDISPVLTFSSSTGVLNTVFIKLYDISGNLMI